MTVTLSGRTTQGLALNGRFDKCFREAFCAQGTSHIPTTGRFVLPASGSFNGSRDRGQIIAERKMPATPCH